MHKRWFLLFIPTLVLLGGYCYLRFSMQEAIHKDEQKTGVVLPTRDTLGSEKVTEADLRPLFIKRLQQLLRYSSNGLYHLSVGNLEVDVLASTVTLQQVTMRPDAPTLGALKKSGKTPDAVFTVSLQKLVIEGINLDDAITIKTMDYKLVRLVNPVIEIDQFEPNGKAPEEKEVFSQRFLQQMQKLDIKKLVVEGGAVITSKRGRKTNRLDNIQVNMKDILLNENTRKDQQRFLFAKAATISFRNYRRPTKDGLYTFKVGKVTVKAPQQQVVLQNLSLTSPLNKKQFAQHHPFSKERYELKLPLVTINHVNWWALINEEEFIADEVITNNGKLSVYFDRSKPSKSRMGKFPNQLLMNVPAKLHIAKLKVWNLHLSYEEYNPVSRQSGTVYLDRVAMDVTNLSNKHRKPIVVDGTALLMRRVPIKARFQFDMANHQQGGFTASITSNSAFEGALLNQFSIPLGLVKIEEGTLQKIQASIQGNQHQAQGDVLLLYNDLKLFLLEKDKDKKALDKKDVTSFLANAFVLKEDNPKEGKEPRQATVTFKRIPEGGFFLLVWKTMLAGALKTIGAPAKIASKTADGTNQE